MVTYNLGNASKMVSYNEIINKMQQQPSSSFFQYLQLLTIVYPLILKYSSLRGLTKFELSMLKEYPTHVLSKIHNIIVNQESLPNFYQSKWGKEQGQKVSINIHRWTWLNVPQNMSSVNLDF